MFSEAYVEIRGKVQGVGYRDFVVSVAKEHRCTGWVQNKDDGSVQVAAQGIPDDLKAFVERLNEGSVLAHVDSVAVDWRTPVKQFVDFAVLF